MHLNQAQQKILIGVQADPRVLSHFEVLCAEFEAALDEVERPEDLEKTDPFGLVTIRSAAETAPLEITEAATVITVAWLEMIASAIMDQDGEIDSLLFDEDGVSIFGDTRPLFEVVRACGIGPAHARRAFARVRGRAKTAPRRALKILGTLRAITVRKRKPRAAGRIKPLAASFAASLGRDEIARAKAGSIRYSLIAMKDGYVAQRVRKRLPQQVMDDEGMTLDIVGDDDADLMDGFDVPLVPCDALHRTALDHFIQFLDEDSVRKPRNTYQRLVHRVLSA